VDLIQIAALLVVGAAAAFLVVTFMGRAQSVAADFREQQVKSGNEDLAELYINLSPETFFILRVALALLLFFLCASSMPVILAVMFSAAGFFVPGVLLARLRRKRVRKVEEQLVEALELLSNCLKSGLTLPQGVELLVKEFPAPISQEFSLVLAESRVGVEFNEALRNMAERLNSNIVQILASGVAITKRCGGDLTVIFQNIAQTIREQATIEGKLDAVTAQGRFQGLILSVLPFAVLVILWFVEPAHVQTLFGYKIGLMAFFGVIVMVVLAQVWIRKLLAIDV